MKKYSFIAFLLTVFLAASAFSYIYMAEKSPANPKKLMWTPENATTKTINSHTVEVTGGQAYEYLAISETGLLLPPAKSAKISCTCTAGSGCNPFSGHGHKGCSMDGCTSCSGTVSVKALNPTGGHSEQTVSNGGFALKKVKVEFASVEQAKKGALVFNALLQTEKAQTAINEFKAKIPASSSGDKVYTLVSIAGRIGMMELPKKFVTDNKGIVLLGKGTCSCTEGTCTYSSSMGVEGCSGNCTGTCSLTTGYKGNKGHKEEIVIDSFGF